MRQWVEKAAQRLGVEATAGWARNTAEIKHAIASFVQKPNGGLVVLPSALSGANAPMIVALAKRYRMPEINSSAEVVALDALVSYGLDWNDQSRRADEYVDRILKGAGPADLLVQKPTRFKLVVNLKAAKAIGLTIPESFLLRADEVIE